MKKWQSEKKWLQRLIMYVILFIVGALISLAVFRMKGLFGKRDLNSAYRVLSDGFFTASVLLMGLGGMVAISATGFFDILVFGMQKFGRTVFSSRLIKKKTAAKDLFEYKMNKEKKVSPHWSMIIVGLVYFLAALVFALLYVPIPYVK